MLQHLRIKSLRKGKDWTQGQLATYAKVERSYITKIEKGGNPNVSGVILARIARALGTSTDFLLGLTDVAARPATADEISAIERAAADPRLRYIVSNWPSLTEELQDLLARYVRLWLTTKRGRSDADQPEHE